ncbi:hypothetical protein CPC08DRAFT_273170 [Agrocybe pediades]|nr:hypothetical protein CPC08DRAFT_273170 [Agrocybe pediades]
MHVVESIDDLRTVLDFSRTAAAALSFLVWDMLLTFDDEVEYVWSYVAFLPYLQPLIKTPIRRKWTITEYAYIWTRYFSMTSQIVLLVIGPSDKHTFFPISHCRYWQIYRATVSIALFIGFDMLAIARVSALYHDRPRIRAFVCVLFALEVVCMVTGQTLGNMAYEYDRSCKVFNLPSAVRMYSSSAIAFQAILFCLTIWKFVQNLRAGWHRIPLFILIVRDGTWAFLLLLAVQGTIFYFTQNAYRRLLYPWMWSICSFCGYRMLLNVRKFAETGSEDRIANINSIPLTSLVTRSTIRPDDPVEENNIENAALPNVIV